MREETGRWKSRWRIWELFADRRCSQAVLDFLTSADVGEIVPAAEEEADGGVRRRNGSSGNARSGKMSGGVRRRCWVLGKNYHCSYPPHPSWHRRGKSRGRSRFHLSFPLSLALVCIHFCRDRPGRRALGELATSRLTRTADRKPGKCTPP